MDRLTVRDKKYGEVLAANITVRGDVSAYNAAIRKLAAYEDINVDPDHIRAELAEMTLDKYQALAQRTSKYKGDPHRMSMQIDNGAKGLCGETGEIMDLLKKHDHQGHELDIERMIDELGDVLWYVAELASGMGTTLGAVARHNVDKLRKRYPDGFEASRSVNREGMG